MPRIRRSNAHKLGGHRRPSHGGHGGHGGGRGRGGPKARQRLPGTPWQRAEQRARQQGMTPIMGANAYYVESSRQGRWYSVQPDGQGGFSCTCPAGQMGNPCKHIASVYLLGGRLAEPWERAAPWLPEPYLPEGQAPLPHLPYYARPADEPPGGHPTDEALTGLPPTTPDTEPDDAASG